MEKVPKLLKRKKSIDVIRSGFRKKKKQRLRKRVLLI